MKPLTTKRRSFLKGVGGALGAGFWNMTSYGVRFLTISRSIGAGGLQL